MELWCGSQLSNTLETGRCKMPAFCFVVAGRARGRARMMGWFRRGLKGRLCHKVGILYYGTLRVNSLREYPNEVGTTLHRPQDASYLLLLARETNQKPTKNEAKMILRCP